MARQPAVPNVQINARPASASSSADAITFGGDLLNYASQMQTLGANERAQSFYRNQTLYGNEMQAIEYQRKLAEDASSAVDSSARTNPVDLMKQQAEELKQRAQLFTLAAQLKSAQMEQDAREADYALAEPLAQLGAYVGSQNWGATYAMRKAIVSNPVYAKSREVRARMEAIDQMLPQWGESFNALGESKSFLDVTREADSPDWATRKEAIRILALNSENPSAFISNLPGLSPMQIGELNTFIKSNPLVTDRNKIAQVRMFEDTFKQKLMEQTGNRHDEYLRQLSSPQTQRQLEDARRAILYGKGSDDASYTNASDRTMDGETLDQLNNYIRDKVADSAGMLSLTRGVGEAGRGIMKLLGVKGYQKLSDDDWASLASAPSLERLTSTQEGINHVGQAIVAGGAVTVGQFLDKVNKYKGLLDLNTKTSLSVLEAMVKDAGKVGDFAKKAAEMSGKVSGILRGIAVGAQKSGQAAGVMLKGIIPVRAVAAISESLGATAVAKWGASKLAGTAGKVGLKGAGTAAGLGLDAFFYYQDAGRDNMQVSDAMKVIRQAQGALQASAAHGEPPPQMGNIMQSLMQAIDTVNTITARHNINVQLDLNNIVSRQIAQRLQGKRAIDSAMESVYNLPPVQDPRAALLPKQPAAVQGAANPYDAYGAAQPQ